MNFKKFKRYKSHLTISSEENNKENKKSKDNIINTEKYIKKLILISIKTKKILEKNDYFYEAEKRKKFDLKNIKIKLTPFQKYQLFKNKKYLTIEKKNNNNKRVLTSYPINNRKRINKNNLNLITISNFDIKHMRKNKTHNNNQFQFYRTHNNFFYKPKRLLTSPNELTEPNDYHYNKNKINNLKLNQKYKTINIQTSNKNIQTSGTKNKDNGKIYSMLDKFPILNIFNYHSDKINYNLFRYKSGNANEMRKKLIKLYDFNNKKINI